MDFQLNEEQREFRHYVHEFVAKELKPMARETDEKGEFNWTAVKKMGPLGLLGLRRGQPQYRSISSTLGAGMSWHSPEFPG